MLKLTSTLLSSLNKSNDDPILQFISEPAKSTVSEPIPSTVDTIPSKIVSTASTAIGSNLPRSIFAKIENKLPEIKTNAEQLIPFYRSPARAEAFIGACWELWKKLTCNKELTEGADLSVCRADFLFEKTKTGYYRWYLKRDDRERGYFSPLYSNTYDLQDDFIKMFGTHCFCFDSSIKEDAEKTIRDYIDIVCLDLRTIGKHTL